MGLSPEHYGLAASAVAAVVATFGLLSMAAAGDWGKRHAPDFSAFAVGYLSVIVLFHFAPDAIELSKEAWRWMLAGFLGLAGVGFAVAVATNSSPLRGNLAVGFASILALGAHSFFDGVLYESIFNDMRWEQAIIAVPGLLLHKFPDGVIAYFLLKESGLDRPRAIIFAFVASALTTVVGSFVASSAFAFIDVDAFPKGPLLALSTGALAYIVLFDLMPHATRVADRKGYLYAGYGMVIALAAVVFRQALHVH